MTTDLLRIYIEQDRRSCRLGPERRLKPRTTGYVFPPRCCSSRTLNAFTYTFSPFFPVFPVASSAPWRSPPTVFTLSGTLGAAYVAVGRGIPAVAFSAGNSTKRSYKDWNPEDPTDIGESCVSVFLFSFVWG